MSEGRSVERIEIDEGHPGAQIHQASGQVAADEPEPARDQDFGTAEEIPNSGIVLRQYTVSEG